jgi:hypothetical protein
MEQPRDVFASHFVGADVRFGEKRSIMSSANSISISHGRVRLEALQVRL